MCGQLRTWHYGFTSCRMGLTELLPFSRSGSPPHSQHRSGYSQLAQGCGLFGKTLRVKPPRLTPVMVSQVPRSMPTPYFAGNRYGFYLEAPLNLIYANERNSFFNQSATVIIKNRFLTFINPISNFISRTIRIQNTLLLCFTHHSFPLSLISASPRR